MAHTTLHKRLQKDIPSALKKELGDDNIMAVPKISKVIVNVGLNQKKLGSKDIQQYVSDTLATITGQKPTFRKGKKSISNFNIREGMILGSMVTLRGKKMHDFLDRLISFVLPRIRDFRGLSPKMDGRGNFSIGISDQSIFPEVPPPEANKIFGMQIQIVTTAGTDDRGRALMNQIGMPFRKSAKKSSAPTP